jgi:peptide/nickel transport system permease protein
MITLGGLAFPALLGGAVFVERIFSWPGMGDATIRAVDARDYEFVTAAVIVGSVLTVTGSLLADWLSQLADPRTRS